MIPHTKPTLGAEEYEAVKRVMESGWFARGKECEAFEREFSEYVGAEYALFTNCCTSALKLAYTYLRKEKQCGFITYPENTYCATYSAAEDVGLSTQSYKLTEEYPRNHRVNVHFGGVKDETPCLVEDSAHRIEPNDPLVGKIRCYSFHPNKNMTSGGGGMFVTNDKKIYEWALLQINDGLVRTKLGRFDYTVEAYAGGYEGGDINATIGREQLKKLPTFTHNRNILVERYNKSFNTNWTGNHIFPLYLKDYGEVKEKIVELEKQGISCKAHYPGSNVMTLPLFPSLTYEQQDEVIEKVKNIL